MAKKCGDKTHLEFQADANLVGEFASITVQRFDKKSVSAYGFQEIAQAKTKMLWPDQEKQPSGHFGGCQVDFKGLGKKSYADKFAQQNFTLRVASADEMVESDDTVVIEELPAVGQVHRNIGITVPVAQQFTLSTWVNGVFTVLGQTVNNFVAAGATGANLNIGDFWIEFTDGKIILTVKIRLMRNGSPAPGSFFRHVKKKAEEFWNGASGFRQWFFHRQGCERKDDCECALVVDNKARLRTGGCCKFPVVVKVEEGPDNVVECHVTSPFWRLGGQAGGRADTANFYFPEGRANTYAHEVGHMIGLPDEYDVCWDPGNPTQWCAGGWTAPAGGTSTNDPSSIMGANQSQAKRAHLTFPDLSNDWVNANVEAMDIIGPP